MGFGHAFGAAVGVGDGQVVDAVGLVLEFGHPVAGAFADGLRKVSGAVIAVIARDDIGFLRAAHAGLVIADHSDRRVHCGGAARCEMHAVQITRRKAGEFGSE